MIKIKEKKVIPIPKFTNRNYEKEFIKKRLKWLSKQINYKLKHIGYFSEDPRNFKGNIENLIGVCQIPIGIAGPLLINGKNAKGYFYIPMATTEGALVATYHQGMRIITKAGGVNASILSGQIHISPVFFVEGLSDAQRFIKWVNSNFSFIKQEAEKTTDHGKLLKINSIIMGRRVVLKFIYNTQDAQGMNMINVATETACKYIMERTEKRFYLRSKFSSVKVASFSNIHRGYGKEVFVDCIIPREIIKIFKTTPEKLYDYYTSCLLVNTHASTLGMTAHIANGITAIYIACGQDVADVSTSHIGISMCELTEKKDLYISLYIPNLLVGTIGGGTGLGTQKECLNILGCYGGGKVNKLAEIITAASLAGELSVLIAVVNGTFVPAHQRLGRNKPQILKKNE